MFDNGFRLLDHIILFTILIQHAQCINTGCSIGSFRLGPKCYDPHLDRTATYSNAQEICQENDGQTVALFENEEISEFLINIGIRYKYQAYAVDHSAHECSSISWENNFEIEEADCKHNVFVACEFDIHNDINLPPNCSSYQNKCYRLFPLRVPASDAHQRCSKMKGRLASLDNSDEQEFFKKLMQEDIWWRQINADAVKNKHFSDFQTFWSGKMSNGDCWVQSYNSPNKSDCDAYNNFFCEYKANPHSSAPTMPTSRTFSTTSPINIETTTGRLDSTSTLVSTSTLDSTRSFGSIKSLIQNSLVIEPPVQESNVTVLQLNPDTSDSRTLKPFEFAIIGSMAGLFIILTIVVVQLIRLRKRLFTKHGNKSKGPQSIPLLPSPSTSPTSLLSPPDNIDQTQTTDGYLIPNTINTPPSDDTRDGYTPIILPDTIRPDLLVGNEIHGNALRGSRPSYNYSNPNNHVYEEIIYNRTGYP